MSEDFQESIEANCSTVIMSGVKSPQDIEYYSGLIGTQTTKKTTEQMQDFYFFEKKTGMKSVREVEEFIAHPNKLKALELGQVFTVSKSVDTKWGLVNVPLAPDFRGSKVSSADVDRAMMATRAQYMDGGDERYLDLSSPKESGPKPKSSEEAPGGKTEKPLWT